jgi:hypothetical protein
MDNSPAHFCYSERSQLQQESYHVSSERAIHYQEQEDTSEQEKDQERVSSIEGSTHESHAAATELGFAL